MRQLQSVPTHHIPPRHQDGTQFILKWAGPPLADRITIRSHHAAREIWKEYVASQAHFDGSKEHMIVMAMNSKSHYLGWHLVAIGTATGVSVPPRELFRAVFAVDAQRVILIHNHPSGELSPSRLDEKFTRDVVPLFRSLQVEFEDHVIVDSEGLACYSMRGGYPEIFEGSHGVPETAKIIPLHSAPKRLMEKAGTLCQGGGRDAGLPPDAFLDASEGPRVGSVVLTLHIPQSVWQGFQDYVRRMLGMNLLCGSSWRDVPVLNALMSGIPDKGKCGWDRPINRPENGLSLKGKIKRIRQLSKEEPSVSITEEMAVSFWEKIQERAEFYGITTGELCVSCIFYYAHLEMKWREEMEKKGLAAGRLGGV